VAHHLTTRIEIQAGARGMTFRPTVLVAKPEQELVWLGRLIFPGVFDGEHRFVITPTTGNAVVFEQSESFRGLLVPLFRKSLDRDTLRGFEEMNTALEQRAESTGRLE